jgi:hypothetical protein
MECVRCDRHRRRTWRRGIWEKRIARSEQTRWSVHVPGYSGPAIWLCTSSGALISADPCTNPIIFRKNCRTLQVWNTNSTVLSVQLPRKFHPCSWYVFQHRWKADSESDTHRFLNVILCIKAVVVKRCFWNCRIDCMTAPRMLSARIRWSCLSCFHLICPSSRTP